MSPPGVYQLRKRDPEFRAQWAVSLREAYLQLELTLLDRSINGRERPIFYAGSEVGRTHHYPDRLAMNLLMHHRAAGAGNDRATPSSQMLVEAQERVMARFDAAQLIQQGDGNA